MTSCFTDDAYWFQWT